MERIKYVEILKLLVEIYEKTEHVIEIEFYPEGSLAFEINLSSQNRSLLDHRLSGEYREECATHFDFVSTVKELNKILTESTGKLTKERVRMDLLTKMIPKYKRGCGEDDSETVD